MAFDRDQARFVAALVASAVVHLPLFWAGAVAPRPRAEIAIVEGEVSIAGALVAASTVRPPPPPEDVRLELLASPDGLRQAAWPKPPEPEPEPPKPEPEPEPEPEPPPPPPEPEPEPEPEPRPEPAEQAGAEPGPTEPSDSPAETSGDATASSASAEAEATSARVGARTNAGSGAVPVASPQPPMPERARDRGIEGQVHLTLTIAADGSIARIVVTKSSGYRWLDRHTTDFIEEHWRYRPAMVDGVPVEADAPVVVDYKLRRR